ncbi:LysR family transcriptional regulator [Acinetobacter sp. TGL-Y2]|uniref:LysR family transcriptional regulator n=1 Tax=Acinetobacter sp. TGL-Y2 TaxID=1407071 RepID=UPI0007A679A4|nr:LysR family transcriptional regulator [Acinetobacter sp. TGL-Y2]AMW78851.1 LysR family transcriptional regulator [Acinetobacter sp. TGL-Y2]
MNLFHENQHLDLGFFPHIDINLYPLFIAVFEHHSMSQAADILCISQSAASHAIQRLRRQMNDDLFIRSGQKMRPTPFAEQIYPVIKTALLSLQNVLKQQYSFEPSMVGSLKIAVHDEIEPIIFPKLIQHFQTLNLDIQFLSIKLNRKTVEADLATQQIDFAIDLEQDLGAKLQFQTLVSDQFMLCTRQPNMDLKRYLASPHIGVSSRRTGVLIEDLYLNKQQLSRQIFLRCQHYSTALQILQQHADAILTIPNSILNHLEVPEHLNIFDLPISLPQMNMGMYWHQNLNGNLRHHFLKEQIKLIFA